MFRNVTFHNQTPGRRSSAKRMRPMRCLPISQTSARRRSLAVWPSHSAGLNNYFLTVYHQDDLATEVIRQRVRKIVYPVGFG